MPFIYCFYYCLVNHTVLSKIQTIQRGNVGITVAKAHNLTPKISFSTFKRQERKHLQLKKIVSFSSGVRHLPTLNQIRRHKPRTKKTKPKPHIPRSSRVLLGPQRKGVCIKVFIRKPKKPNSANRKCALLKLSDGKIISAYIPGEKGQLQEHGVVLFEGGRVQDCPGIKYKIIRGKLDMN